MYIGGGAIVLILIIVLVVLLMRRGWSSGTGFVASLRWCSGRPNALTSRGLPGQTGAVGWIQISGKDRHRELDEMEL